MTTPAVSGKGIRPAPQHWRIKLYELEEQGAWIDKGTGFVHCKVVSELGGPALVIRSEENDGVIFFKSKIYTDDVYEVQGDNIIMWREAEAQNGQGVDYALSFQESAGCSAIWEQIAAHQQQFLQQQSHADPTHLTSTDENSHTDHALTQPDGSAVDERGEGRAVSFGIGPILSILELSRSPTNSSRSNSVATSQGYNSSGLLLVLPVDFAEENFLQRVRYKLENLYPAQRDFAVCQLLNHEGAYMEKLFRIFEQLEAKKDTESLNIMADIFRAVLLLNNPDLLEHLIVSDKAFYSLCGAMEYDRTLAQQGRYRDFLFRTARYREVVPLDGALGSPAEVADMRAGCQVLYRLRHVRDIMLHPKIDDPGITAIGSMISFSSSEICTLMLQNTGYLARVLNVVWPALHIDNYLPAAAAPSESRTVSPEASDCEGPAVRSGTRRGRTDSLDSEEMDVVVGPMPAAVVAATGSSGGAVSPVVTPPHSGSAPTSPVAAPTTSTTNTAAAAAVQEAPPPSPLSSPEISIHSAPAPIAQPSSPGISSIRADPQPQPVSRPIDGLLFLRELFAMSKFLQLEKRVELFHQFYEYLHQPLFLVINKVLVECRSSGSLDVGTPSPLPSSPASLRDTGNSPPLKDTSLFLPQERTLASQIVGEILTALCIVCPSLLRQVVLSCAIPSVNPMSPNTTAGSSNNNIATTAYTGRLKKTITPDATTAGWWEHSTLFLLIDSIVNSPDSFTIQSFGDVLKLALDLEKAPTITAKNENYKFLSYFYDHYLAFLLVPFLDSLDPAQPVPASYYHNLNITPHYACTVTTSLSTTATTATATAGTTTPATVAEDFIEVRRQPNCAVHASRRLIFETLVQCVTAHSYRFKYYAMRNSILSKILQKTFQNNMHSWLHVQGLKFIKALISVKDEYYYKHIEKLDLLKNMLLIFRDISHKDNMVTACFLEVIEEIRILNVKNLICYIMNKYSGCFEGLKLQSAVFERLQIKFDQIMDRSFDGNNNGKTGSGIGLNDRGYLTGTRGRQQRTFSDFDSEEDYFNGDDEVSVPSSSSSAVTHRSDGMYAGGNSGDAAGTAAHRDKRIRSVTIAPTTDTAAAIANIVSGAFQASEPTSSLTSSNITSRATTTGGGSALQRSHSLDTASCNSNSNSTTPRHADHHSVASAHSSGQSTTAGLRSSLMAMLGAYGIEDEGLEEEELKHDQMARTPSLTVKAHTHTNHHHSGSMNIYDEEDLHGGGVSELSDCSEDEEGHHHRSHHLTTATSTHKRTNSAVSDFYAGDDFVHSNLDATLTAHPSALSEQQPVGVGEDSQEGDLPLPPLRSRYSEEEEPSFLAVLQQNQLTHSHAHSTTSTNSSSGGSIGISFSLKKKPKM